MKQSFMGFALLVVGVVFNPPPILSKAKTKLLEQSNVYANLNKEAMQGEKALLSGRLPNFHIVINVPATELRLYEDNELLRRIPIAVGQARYPSPTQKLDKITRIEWNPWWIPPDSEWAKDDKPTPPGPANPLGVVKMPLSNAVLLHGTNKPWSIGNPASHACIRLFNEDAKSLAWLFQSNLTPKFDTALLETYAQQRWKTFSVPLPQPIPVQFIYETVEIEGREVRLHPDLYWKVRDKNGQLLNTLKSHGVAEEQIDMKRLKEIVQQWKQGKNKVTILLDDLLQNT